ncbi:MAG: serine hydrolase domain-containing protein [Gemmatimonadales bacterium]
MRTLGLQCIVLLASCLGPDLGLDAQTARAAELQAVLDRWATLPGRQGVTASVILPDGTQWSGVAGFEKASVPMRPEHLIWIASVTKTMTGAVILQLAEEGRLSLADTLGRWLPPLANVDPAITIRQLLNHTSGLSSYAPAPLFRAKGDSTYVFSPAELATTIAPPVAAPGVKTHYTNTTFLLLGWIAERVTGQPLARAFHERLWDPLGLEEIFLAGREPAVGAVADGFLPDGTGPIPPLANLSRSSAGHGAGSVFTTARNLARWGQALFTGKVLSPGMQAAMRTLVPAAGNIPGESGAGLGIRGYDFLGGRQYGHSGGAVLGTTLLVYDPESGVVVAVMINRGSSPDHFQLVPELLAVARKG